MAEHTPGPWFLEKIGGNYAVRAKAADGEGRDVAPPPVEPADARLIAAAPDLLEALEDLLDDRSAGARTTARLAIANARGTA